MTPAQGHGDHGHDSGDASLPTAVDVITENAPGGRSFRWIALSFIPLMVALVLVLFLARHRESGRVDPLVRIRSVPEFSLIERSGRTVTNEDLRGHVWLADFFFTSCAGPCPEMSLRMRGLQKEIARYGGAVKLVSVSIDPIHDQPPVLRSYAERYGADPDLWWFLTSNDEDAMHEMVRDGFLQSVIPATGGRQIIHSTYFVLVDQEGFIRNAYEGLDPASKPRILRDIPRLLDESPAQSPP